MSDPVDTSKFPEFGTLRGKRVRLVDAVQKLSQEDLEQVKVVLPDGGGTVRPWRFVGSGKDAVVLTVNGKKTIFV